MSGEISDITALTLTIVLYSLIFATIGIVLGYTVSLGYRSLPSPFESVSPLWFCIVTSVVILEVAGWIYIFLKYR
jgi:hypothetical protein